VIVYIIGIFLSYFLNRRTVFKVSGKLYLFIAISTIHLGPFLGYGDELTRFDEDLNLRSKILKFEDLGRIFVPLQFYEKVHGINYVHYISIPIFVFAAFIPYSLLRKYWIFFVILLVGFLMALHDQTFFAPTITYIFPILDLGRWVLVSYIIFIIIPIIIFAISGLKSIIEIKYTKRQLIIRGFFCE